MTARVDYGVDAPGVVRANLILGGVFATAAAIGLAWPRPIAIPTPVPVALPAWLAIAAAFIATLLFALAGVMLWSSLIGKKRVVARLVDALALTGDERVLDAGCGRGLALIACARRLTTGTAIGIDLWQDKDLSDNHAQAVLVNAAAEGVADRVVVETGDMTRLHFPDASFDVVVSMTVLHNIGSPADRDRALGECIRMLKPGGRIAIFDLLHIAQYAQVLRAAGLQEREIGHARLWFLSGRSLIAHLPLQP